MLSYSRNSYDPRTSQQAADDDQRFAQKIEMLRRAFDEIDLNGNDSLSQHELLTYLDLKSKGQFNRDIAEELYEQMDKDHDGKITVNEFVRVFLEADIILRKKIQAARNYQETYKQRIQECQEKAEEAHHTEQINAYGISQNSIVSTIIMETRPEADIAPATIMNCFLEVSLDGQQAFRTEVFRDMSSYPYWDDKFTFQVSSPESVLGFALYKETPLGDEVLGNTSIALHQLTDQSLVDTWINLNTRGKTGSDLELHVKLQWIHSKAEYYTMEARKYEENYQKEEEEIIEYEKYLDNLNEPFQGLTAVTHVKRQESPQHYPEPLPQIHDMPVDMQPTRPDKHFSFNEPSNSQLQMQAQMPRPDRSERPGRLEDDPRVHRNLEPSVEHSHRINQENTAEEIDTRLEVLMNKAAFLLVQKSNPNEWFWKRLALIFCLVEIAIATLITFGRPAFIDLIFPIIVILYIEYGVLKEVISLKYIALAILGSIVILDFMWLLIYSGVWRSSFAKEVTLESGVRGFAVFFTYINLIVKLVWGLLCYMAGIKSTKPQSAMSLAALH